MQIIRRISAATILPHPIVGLGNFDGVHVGHRRILSRVVDEARLHGGTAIALTFHPHPLTVIRPEHPVPLILGLREKVRRLAEVGVDCLVLQPFSPRFARLNPETFVREFLVERLRVAKIFVGQNFTFGHNREGTSEVLVQLGDRFAFEVDVVAPVAVEEREVSSTLVRSLLRGGNMGDVASLLGDYYTLTGRVVTGFRRGRKIGFPTANLRPKGASLLPNGVYAVRVLANDRSFKGVANVGTNPTFGNEQKSVEAHVLDFSEDLYGQIISIYFVERLRDERKFDKVEDLIRQISKDADDARRILAGRKINEK